VGSPGRKHRKRDIPKGVMKRLRDVGFNHVARSEETLGVVARKK
jgi:predicted methyltransferase